MRFTLMWKKWEKYIADILRDFDGGTVVSEAEQRLVGGILHKYGCSTPIQIVPNGVDISHYQDDFGKPVPNSLVFTGALTYSANYNAMEFFLGEIYPLIQEKCSSVRLAVTGRLQGVPIERLPARPGVTFTDYLEDVRPTIASSWVSIVPLRIGGGTRLKILESLAIGTPVVSTSKGAEGLELTPDQDILIADTPSEFASAVLRLLADPILRQALSNRGKRAVAARYDWQRIGQSLNEFISQVTGN
jgi:glycosyltransferase involved in cell wall biosynthesis